MNLFNLKYISENKNIYIRYYPTNFMKKKVSITLDEEIINWAIKESKSEHINLSSFLNKQLWKSKT